MLQAITQFFSLILHIDQVLDGILIVLDGWTYLVVFLIVFCETGLVVTPFLPGDSLLFAAGALAGSGKLQLSVLLIGFFIASVIGDAVNYSLGRRFGKQVIETGKFWFIPIKREYIDRAQEFYASYGGRAVVFARFLPIVRTGVPFIAGVGEMSRSRFQLFNVLGGFLWSFSFTLAGYAFGNIPSVKEHFSLVIIGIIVASFIPSVLEVIRQRRIKKNPVELIRSEKNAAYE